MDLGHTPNDVSPRVAMAGLELLRAALCSTPTAASRSEAQETSPNAGCTVACTDACWTSKGPGRESSSSEDSTAASADASPNSDLSADVGTEACDELCQGSFESTYESTLAVLLAGHGDRNRAYCERLARAAAESALKGYNVKRQTHILRRTRVHKTLKRTDMLTMQTKETEEQTEKVEEWIEEGPPSMIGVGVICSRTRTTSGEKADGSSEVLSSECRGRVGFWLGGGSAETCAHRSFDFATSSVRADGAVDPATLTGCTGGKAICA